MRFVVVITGTGMAAVVVIDMDTITAVAVVADMDMGTDIANAIVSARIIAVGNIHIRLENTLIPGLLLRS